MKLSASTVILPEISDYYEIADLVARHGYDAIEWRVQTDYHIHPGCSLDEAAKVKDACEKAGVGIASLATYLPPSDTGAVRHIVDVATTVGAPAVRLFGTLYDPKKGWRQLRDEARAGLAGVEQTMREAGVRALIEIHFDTIHASPSATKDIVADFSPEWLGVIMDPSNMIIEGYENWRMSVEVLGEYLAHVHWRNSCWYQQDGAWAWKWARMQEGQVDWLALISILKDASYRGYLSNENILGVPTSSKGYAAEEHKELGGYDESRSVEERLSEITYIRQLIAGGE